MREASGRSPRRGAAPLAAAVLALLLVLALGAGRGGLLVLPLLALLPLILPGLGPGGGSARAGLVRGLLAVLLAAGFVAVLLLRSAAALGLAILLLWLVPLAVSGLAGPGEAEPR